MRLLAFDTCLAACSVAVHDTTGQRTLAARRLFMERGQAEAVAPLVRTVMAEAGLGFAEVDAIAVTTGPGTFTGVRIGIALAQGLALSRHIPVIGIDTMRATAAPLLGRGADIVVCHRAGGTGQAYVQHFSPEGDARHGIALLRPGAITVGNRSIVVGTAAQDVPGDFARAAEHDLPDAAAFAAHAATLPANAHARLVPVYVREADAKPQAALKPPALAIAVAGADVAPQLSSLHALAFVEGWSAAAIAEMLKAPGTLVLAAFDDLKPVGFLMLRAVAGEAEILALATHPMLQRRGVATRLLDSSSAYLAALGVRKLFLEVAADNAAALALYDGKGFIRCGLRKNYYARKNAAACDAIVMERTVARAGP